jgi:uncharacterized protein
MSVLWATVLLVILLVCWGSTLVGLPGNWMMILAVAVYVYLVPPDWRTAISWWTVLSLTVLAALGELIELLASVYGASKVGGSKRGAALSLVGSIVGGLVGAFVALPLPVIGPIVGALLFASVGALAGAMLGEYWKGAEHGDVWKIGQAAFWGRLFGTLAKVWVGAVMVVTAAVALAF